MSKIGPRPRTLLSLSFVMSALAMSVASGRLRAQSSSPPTVNVTRLTTLNQNVWPGDFNGDGKPDLIVANHYAWTLNIFANTSTPGLISFTALDFSQERAPTDVVAVDASALAGIALTSHDTSAVATAKFVDPIVGR
jgi:hypothetical protein